MILQRTVLVVEDDPQLQMLAVRVLESAGYRAVVAGNGNEAMSLAAAAPAPDLVLMDLALPGEDGISVTQRLRAVHPTLEVIAVSAHALPRDRERAREAGCIGFLTKPYQIDHLVEVVRGALGETAPA